MRQAPSPAFRSSIASRVSTPESCQCRAAAAVIVVVAVTAAAVVVTVMVVWMMVIGATSWYYK